VVERREERGERREERAVVSGYKQVKIRKMLQAGKFV
jgi:hypothetical protein